MALQLTVPRVAYMTQVTLSHDVERAEQFERLADGGEYDRGECAFEAAAAWRRAGNLDRARAVLVSLFESHEPLDIGLACATLADIELEGGHAAAADGWLRRILAMRPRPTAVCAHVGEMFEEMDRLAEALHWFNLSTAHVDDERAEAVARASSFLVADGHEIAGRARVRRKLGLPLDRLDEAAEVLRRRLISQFTNPDEAEPDGAVVRYLVWQRAEARRAQERWPCVREPDDAHYRGMEARLRDYAARGARRIVLVPAYVDGMAAHLEQKGVGIDDEAARWQYMNTRSAAAAIEWPPPRNATCWCGSERKYKKCCGGPAAV